MTDIPLDDVARQLGQQLLQILSLQQRIAAQQQEIAALKDQRTELMDDNQRLHDEVERLKMEITRRGLDEAVANARHKSTRSEPSDE